ncbi:lysine-2,3-aminomutase-like protein [Xanthobacter autotrophicus]|uniref:lysine-2,3-aminomutase-like protein n=1 Tax=Xanthobacter TaxID=279 RepID=UPI0024AA8E72|nr:lysine-2,3-aminomutase-like protein [Xanthobacter autotrophicus]MDI4662905.1 lysine-2,3-aminomutase-like protein [Xanthobacter autotrophicus]
MPNLLLPNLLPLPARDQGTLRSGDDLVAAGLADARDLEALTRVAARYAVAVPPTLAAAIDRTDAADPIARQFVPHPAELEVRPEELADPIGDEAHSPVPGIVHRYPDRALLKIVGVCAVYCRFCFRREMVGPGAAATLSPEALDEAFAYLAAHPEIWEVILTGGDPFMLSPRRMGEVMARLAALPHVKIVRFHTRVPIAAPERVSDAFIAALKAPGLTSYVAVHVNHARELTPAARSALTRMADAGIPLLSQSVLLRGVNDDAETLATLFRSLVECRVKPYYLHHPDLAPGTAHFRLDIARGQELMRALRGRLSGIALPTYVLDIPGGAGKVPLTPDHLAPAGARLAVSDNCGGVHLYPPEG